MSCPACGVVARRTGIAVLLLVALLTAAGCGDTEEATEPESPAPAEGPEPQTQIDESVEEPSVEPLQQHTVEIYFPSVMGDGLIGEYREIFLTATPEDRAKQIIADLISGPSGSDALRAVPAGTSLRQAYVLQNGVAYLDFSRDLKDGIGGGSMMEILTVYSIVDSVVRNVPEITRVGLMINGKSLETLNGHIDLRRPLAPDYSLILMPTITRDSRAQAGSILASVLPTTVIEMV